MSQIRTATSPKPTRRRGGRSKSMAVDTRVADKRYTHVRRREQASMPRFDWRDWLIPGALTSCLTTIVAYHHDVVFNVVSHLL